MTKVTNQLGFSVLGIDLHDQVFPWVYDLPNQDLIRVLQSEQVWNSLWSELMDCQSVDDVVKLLLDYGWLEVYATYPL